MNFPAGQYRCILADPPWSYKMYGETGYEKSPQAHYPCMTQDELKALRDQVVFATAQDAALVMWTCFPFLPAALELMAHWGFTYKTGGVWNKTTPTGKLAFGTGYILRASAELFLIGTHGSPGVKNKGTRNVLFEIGDPVDIRELGINISAERREHSRKPYIFHDVVSGLFEGPYLELFGREQRTGWTVWGNQTDKFQEAT